MKLLLYAGLVATLALGTWLAIGSPAVRRVILESTNPARAGRSRFAPLFVLYGLIAVPCLAFLTPPYQVSDEANHFLRADQVSLGAAVGHRSGTESGGVVDKGIAASLSVFYPIVLQPKVKATADMFERASRIDWHAGKSFSGFENTSIYPPFFYALSAFGIVVGKAANLSVVSTLTLSRLLNGIAAVGLGALAIGLAGPAAPWFFAVLTLPMTMSQMASVSQDALMFPAAAVAAGLFIRLLRNGTQDIREFALLCLLLALISTGRFTYATLALLPLLLRDVRLGYRLIGAVCIVATALAWSSIASAFALIQFGLAGADAHAQVRHLLADPASIFSVAVNTAKYQYDLYLESFVGKLGWLDLRLPETYHELAWADLALALLGSVTWAHWRTRSVEIGTVLVAILASIAALFGALYISWTPVGNFIVDGVQGRYFIPLAFFVPAVFATGRSLRFGRAGLFGKAAIASFPLVTIPVVLTSTVTRYYLG